MSGRCELCGAPVLSVFVGEWDGGLDCDCGRRHYVCEPCSAEWGLVVRLGPGRVEPCPDAVRTARAVAGEGSPLRGFPNPCAEIPLGERAKVVVGDEDAPASPHLLLLTPEQQDEIERRLADAIAEQVAKDADAALRRQAVADAEVRRAAREAGIRGMGAL